MTLGDAWAALDAWRGRLTAARHAVHAGTNAVDALEGAADQLTST